MRASSASRSRPCDWAWAMISSISATDIGRAPVGRWRGQISNSRAASTFTTDTPAEQLRGSSTNVDNRGTLPGSARRRTKTGPAGWRSRPRREPAVTSRGRSPGREPRRRRQPGRQHQSSRRCRCLGEDHGATRGTHSHAIPEPVVRVGASSRFAVDHETSAAISRRRPTRRSADDTSSSALALGDRQPGSPQTLEKVGKSGELPAFGGLSHTNSLERHFFGHPDLQSTLQCTNTPPTSFRRFPETPRSGQVDRSDDCGVLCGGALVKKADASRPTSWHMAWRGA